jgi:hypothetical protein
VDWIHSPTVPSPREQPTYEENPMSDLPAELRRWAATVPAESDAVEALVSSSWIVPTGVLIDALEQQYERSDPSNPDYVFELLNRYLPGSL